MNMKINNVAPRFARFQTVVDNKLVRGRAVTCPLRLYKMKKAGITQIVDLRNTSYIERPLEKFFCKMLGIKYENFKYPKGLSVIPEKKFFDGINNAIVNNSGKTYIHCQSGKRRTGVCVAVYEREHSLKATGQIISKMLKSGFKDMIYGRHCAKRDRLIGVYNDFMQKYFPHGGV